MYIPTVFVRVFFFAGPTDSVQGVRKVPPGEEFMGVQYKAERCSAVCRANGQEVLWLVAMECRNAVYQYLYACSNTVHVFVPDGQKNRMVPCVGGPGMCFAGAVNMHRTQSFLVFDRGGDWKGDSTTPAATGIVQGLGMAQLGGAHVRLEYSTSLGLASSGWGGGGGGVQKEML